jgi:hypothetical protein
MAEERAPGVFVEEVFFRSLSIRGVPTWAWALIALLVAFAIARHRGVVG